MTTKKRVPPAGYGRIDISGYCTMNFTYSFLNYFAPLPTLPDLPKFHHLVPCGQVYD